ncbi:unnamed protein product [Soboliphyme baturini]|uniref:Carn_acyltransf domain-containing protein n=1 Tax=Soboliphyme baturini TaxID=241478 RepID=A0A183IGH6_9BILA|nr:unnamed protein product [Soboliphyme baturini]
MRPLLNDEKYERMVKLSNEFKNTIGPRLQRYLCVKALFASNYVSDWWEEYVYLRSRAPIIINSNYYGLDYIGDPPTKIWAARAANITYGALLFRRLIERQELKPITICSVPLCSGQYERTFNTTRVPGINGDVLKHYEDSRHIVVFHHGCWFRVTIHNGRRLLTPRELEITFQKILDSDCQPDPDEMHIAALTAANRKFWAEVRLQLLNDGANKQSVTSIETAAFAICFDDDEYGYDPNDYTKLDHWAGSMLHGNGFDRWFDKSFNFIVGRNCKIRESINLSLQNVQNLIQEVDLKILMYKEYGKGFIKKCHLSPDGYIQAALQLVYYRDQGKFCLTYESSMTRLFRDGRTETIRAKERKRKLLKAACEVHRTACIDAMCGKGVDRHLFCLYVVDRYLELDSPFLKEVLSEPWLLSTSQTPQNQSALVDYKKCPQFVTFGGGFGPVADDGYGVSYIVVGEDTINFHVSSKSSCAKTVSTNTIFVFNLQCQLCHGFLNIS